jgi:hypothetical protein
MQKRAEAKKCSIFYQQHTNGWNAISTIMHLFWIWAMIEQALIITVVAEAPNLCMFDDSYKV